MAVNIIVAANGGKWDVSWSGWSSDIVDLVKKFPGRSYNADTKTWTYDNRTSVEGFIALAQAAGHYVLMPDDKPDSQADILATLTRIEAWLAYIGQQIGGKQ